MIDLLRVLAVQLLDFSGLDLSFCASSFVGSMWASSGLVLDLRLFLRTSLSCTFLVGSGWALKEPSCGDWMSLVVIGCVFFIWGLSFYLDVVNSHLLLSLAGLGTGIGRESRAAVLPPSSGALLLPPQGHRNSISSVRSTVSAERTNRREIFRKCSFRILLDPRGSLPRVLLLSMTIVLL